MNCPNCGSAKVQPIGGDKIRCGACMYTGPMEQQTTVYSSVVTKNDSVGEMVFEKNQYSVLEIQCETEEGCGSGSGFIINNQGYAITNVHVIDFDGEVPNYKARIQGGQWVEFEVEKRCGIPCSTNDIALIKLLNMPRGAKPVKLGDSDKMKNGSPIYVIGNSLGHGTCIVAGIVSDKDRNGYIMHDAQANPGNSGGPMFNKDGEVISVVVSKTLRGNGQEAHGMNNSIPINHVKKLLGRYL